MSDLISRQDAILALLEKGQRSRRYKLGEIWELNFDEIREAIATVPSAEPKRVKWISKMVTRDGEYAGWICSNCGYFTADSKAFFYNYCPECGAKMREDHDSD